MPKVPRGEKRPADAIGLAVMGQDRYRADRGRAGSYVQRRRAARSPRRQEAC